MKIVLVAAIGVAAVLATSAPAWAIERSCPAGQIWDANRGACRKAGGGGKAKKYADAVAHIEGRGKKPDAKKGLAALEDLCKGKHGEACTFLGYVHRNGRGGVKTDYPKALEHYEKGCNLEDWDGCIGAYEVHAWGLTGTSSYAKGAAFLQKACDGKHGRSCRLLAQAYDWGAADLLQDKDKAQKLYQAALPMLEKDCKDKDGKSCWQLGTMHRDGYGAAVDLTKAISLLEKGCAYGSGDACYDLAYTYDPDAYLSYVQGREKLINRDKAFELYEKACNKYDHSYACYQAVMWLKDGKVQGDLGKLEPLAKRVCETSAYSCNVWAVLKDEGKGVAMDRAGALALYEKACVAGNSIACTTAADRYYAGDGAAYSVKQAITYWEKACELWDSKACSRAAEWHLWGDSYAGLQPDPARAMQMFELGCTRGAPDACMRAGDLELAGTEGSGVSDPKKAAEYYMTACNYSYSSACTLLGDLYADGRATGTPDLASAALYYEQSCQQYGYYYGGYSYADMTGCRKAVDMKRTGNGVAKDIHAAGVLQITVCRNWGSVDDCLLADKLLAEAAVADDYAKGDVFYRLDDGCRSDYAEDYPVETNCVALALMQRDGSYSIQKNPKESVRRLKESCDRYNMEACFHLGAAYEKGLGEPKDLDQARVRYTMACDNGFREACVAMARVAGDPREAVEVFARLCKEEHAGACGGAANAYYFARGVDWNVTEALSLYDRGCTLGDAISCAMVGEMAQYGIGGEPDANKAYAQYQKACDAGNQPACGRAGWYIERGEGGASKDTAKAEPLYAAACEKGEAPDACRWQADLLKAEKKGSASKIAQLYQRALSLAKAQSADSPYHLWLLGTFHRDGVATVKSPAAAAELFVKACEASHPLGCLDAGRLYLEPGGPGLDANREVAAVHLDKACAASVAEACRLAETARTDPGPGVVGPQGKGCCDAGGEGAPGSALLTLAVALLIGGRRRRARDTRRASC